MGLYVSTTGTNVDLVELGTTLVHPEVDYDLLSQFSPDELQESETLTLAIRTGVLIWKKTAGGGIELPLSYDEDFTEIDQINTGVGNLDDRAVTFKNLSDVVAVSASPGYSYGDTGKINNAWLLRPGGPPSNKTGINLGLAFPILNKITCGSEAASTYDIEIHQHDGGGLNMTLITTVTVPNVAKYEFSVAEIYPLTNPILQNRHVAVRITNGAVKNPGVDLQFSGSVA